MIFFCDILLFNAQSFKNFSRMSTLWRRNFFIKWSMTSKVIQGHIRSLIYQNHFSSFVYGPILMKTFMNANVMGRQYMTWNVTFLLWRSFLIFNFKTFYPNYNITYVLMDIFCPCLIRYWITKIMPRGLQNN